MVSLSVSCVFGAKAPLDITSNRDANQPHWDSSHDPIPRQS